jgi:hypothetical protein
VKGIWKRAAACFLVIVAVGTLGFGCGEGGGKEKTIVIGLMTDMTGPSGSFYASVLYAVQDATRYVNEEEPIPGAKIKIEIWDERSDASRIIPGYDWLKYRGAKVILSPQPEVPETLKAFAERDKVPVFTWASSEVIVQPPGWVFCVNANVPDMMHSLLKYVSDQWPNYPTRPKIAYVGWSITPCQIQANALKDYCQANPDEFELVGTYLPPVGTSIWAGEIEATKGCDYVFPMFANYVRDFRARGYRATLLSAAVIASGSFGAFVDLCGWEDVDGTIESQSTGWWNEQYPLAELAKEVLHSYRPSQEQEIMHEGMMYSGIFHGAYMMYDIVRQAVEEVGADNFDGQAFYDAAVKFNKSYEGLYEVGFTQTERTATKYYAIYKWSAEQNGLVKLTGWLPLTD